MTTDWLPFLNAFMWIAIGILADELIRLLWKTVDNFLSGKQKGLSRRAAKELKQHLWGQG